MVTDIVESRATYAPVASYDPKDSVTRSALSPVDTETACHAGRVRAALVVTLYKTEGDLLVNRVVCSSSSIRPEVTLPSLPEDTLLCHLFK
jgi:hypothetical protein